jgi:hypothetical protein
MPRHRQRIPLQAGLQLNVNRLISEGFIRPGKVIKPSIFYWWDDEGNVRASALIEADLANPSANDARFGTMRIHADQIDQTIRLVSCPRHFGGRQWYFVCPAQNRYVSVLWFIGKLFDGRKAFGKQVAYASQFYLPETRAQHMKNKLCDRIGEPDASEEWDVPPKPKWMRWRTYERLSKRFEKYRDQAGLLPEPPWTF